jgi:F-type H+-transporting ATPase subunit epsilon
MQLDILTPEDRIFSGEVKLIQLPGTSGSFEIMNNHAPLISSLKAGRIKIKSMGNETSYFTIKGGIVEVVGNKVIILAQ